jgi:DNA polymerase-3 subunit delta
LDAIGAATEEDGFRPLVHAVLAGETGRIDGELRRMREQKMNAVGLLLAVERRAAQLTRIRAQLGPRGNMDNLGKGEKAQLGIFFREEREIRTQLSRWSPAKLDRLSTRLIAAHQALLSNSQMADTLLAQELVAITRFAAPKS